MVGVMIGDRGHTSWRRVVFTATAVALAAATALQFALV
jgi:hypothetical protein